METIPNYLNNKDHQVAQASPITKHVYYRYEVMIKHIPSSETSAVYVNAISRWEAIYQAYLYIKYGNDLYDKNLNNYSLVTAVQLSKICETDRILNNFHAVIKNIYKSQGYYSALAFLINAGFASSNSLAEANDTLCEVLNLNVLINDDLVKDKE